MRAVWISVLVGVMLGICGAPVIAGEHVESEGNIIAAHLVGMWEAEEALPQAGRAVFVYRQDPGVLTQLLARYRGFLMRKRVYSAGTLTRDGLVMPAVVIELNGNPCLLTFQGSGVAGQYLALVPGGQASGDRLFLGGEKPEDAFRGYIRRGAGKQG